MSDLVERLRKANLYFGWSHHLLLTKEAADRIEELEAKVAQCCEVLTEERAFNRDLVAHANATWQCVLTRLQGEQEVIDNE